VAFPVYSWEIDWDNDGVWGEAGHDITARVLDEQGFTCERGRDQVLALGQPAAGRADLGSIDNRSKDYSTEYASSPLAGNLLPGRRARARATHSSTTYALWAGIVDDIEQRPEEKQVSIPLLGTLSRLAGQRVTTSLASGITTGVAIGHILDAVGWPAGERSLQPGLTTLQWWWLEDEDAFDAIARLVTTEGPGAAAYERGDGHFVFENRHHRLLTARATTAQATFRDSGAAPHHTTPFAFGAQLKDVINTVSIPVYTRTVLPPAVVWHYDQPFNLPPATTVRIHAQASEPFFFATTPEAGVDYTVLVGSIASITLQTTSGQSVGIFLTAGAVGAQLSGLQLRAWPTTKVESRVTSTVDVSASLAKYGVRPYTLPVWPDIDVNTAQDLANAIALAYREPRASATITVAGVDDTHLAHCLGREISDRIRVVEAQTGLDADMMIERIEHRIDWGGRRHVTRFGCEKATVVGTYATWGVSVWGSAAWAF
jgi:hypothetical protein